VEGPLLLWWSVLCAAAAVNVAAWLFSFWLFRKRNEKDLTREALLWLSAVYVLGCAFRSVLPMVDVPRMCLHDAWISRIAIGRTIATVAEIAFAIQWALLLREAGLNRIAKGIVALIVLAEVFSWSAVVTGNNLLHALENSLWALSAALALAGFGALDGRLPVAGRRFLYAAAVCGGAFVAFMVIVDVPMYVARWMEAAPAPPLADNLRSLVERCLVDRDWLAWREDALWLTLYFTAAVWISLALPHAPVLRRSA
jgi:hypothetical protein